MTKPDAAHKAYQGVRANHLLTYPECRRCGSEERVVVHHLRYRGKGKERPGDLMTLCTRCHDALHKSLGQGSVSVESTLEFVKQPWVLH